VDDVENSKIDEVTAIQVAIWRFQPNRAQVFANQKAAAFSKYKIHLKMLHQNRSATRNKKTLHRCEVSPNYPVGTACWLAYRQTTRPETKGMDVHGDIRHPQVVSASQVVAIKWNTLLVAVVKASSFHRANTPQFLLS